MFRGFLDKIGSDPQTTDNFAVPFEINQLEKEYDHAYDNATAIALYDLIWDLGLGDIRYKGLSSGYNPDYGDLEDYFTIISDTIICDAENNPENYLTFIPTLESISEEDELE